MTEILFHEKVVTADGDIVEARIIKVSQSASYPEGLRYAVVYIHQNRRVVGYDNFEQKGHHKHLEDEEFPYHFESVEKLLKDFLEDVERWKSKK